jgi:hypothetical protein
MLKTPRGMPTNGIGKPVDWLNRTVTLVDDPDFAPLSESVLDARRKLARQAAERAKISTQLKYRNWLESRGVVPRFAGDDRGRPDITCSGGSTG